jgi:hypothetical protein
MLWCAGICVLAAKIAVIPTNRQSPQIPNGTAICVTELEVAGRAWQAGRFLLKILKKILALDPLPDILWRLAPVGMVCLTERGLFMQSGLTAEVDFIEELRLRRWARENYVPANQRKGSWHPVVHDEMVKKDIEADLEELTPQYA